MGGPTQSLGFDVLPAATRVTQGFGCTDYAGEWYAPWCPAGRFHAGLDLAADDIHGQPVYATRAGVVVANQDPAHTIRLCPEIGGGTVIEPYLGSQAVILQAEEPGRAIYIEYGHLDSAAVQPGARVAPGQLLGYVGTHGASCGDHLHLEVRTDGPWQGVADQAAAVIDPTPYLMAPRRASSPGGEGTVHLFKGADGRTHRLLVADGGKLADGTRGGSVHWIVIDGGAGGLDAWDGSDAELPGGGGWIVAGTLTYLLEQVNGVEQLTLEGVGSDGRLWQVSLRTDIYEVTEDWHPVAAPKVALPGGASLPGPAGPPGPPAPAPAPTPDDDGAFVTHAQLKAILSHAAGEA